MADLNFPFDFFVSDLDKIKWRDAGKKKMTFFKVDN